MFFCWFPWFFNVVSCLFTVFGWFPWFFKVVSWFIILLLVNVPEMQKMSSRNTKMQKNKSFNSVVQPTSTSTSTSTNISSAFAIDVSGCAHNRHGFWLVSMGFRDGFMVFHGFWLVSIVFQGGSMVFQGSSMVFHGFWLVFMGF